MNDLDAARRDVGDKLAVAVAAACDPDTSEATWVVVQRALKVAHKRELAVLVNFASPAALPGHGEVIQRAHQAGGFLALGAFLPTEERLRHRRDSERTQRERIVAESRAAGLTANEAEQLLRDAGA